MENKVGRPKFFQEIFLVADTQVKVILKMLFLKINNMNMSFNKETLIWRFYITNKVLAITKQVQIINKKNYIITVLDINSKIFVQYMVIWEWEEMPIHSKKQAQIDT